MLAALLVLTAAPQDAPAPVGPLPTPSQAAFLRGGLHGRIEPERGAPADPTQWVAVAAAGELAGLVVRTAGNEPWLEALVEAAEAAQLPLGWSLAGDLDDVARLLERTRPFLVEVQAEGGSDQAARVSAAAPGALLLGSPDPDVAPLDRALQPGAWVAPLERVPLPGGVDACEALHLETVGRGQRLALELPLDGSGRVPTEAKETLEAFAVLRARTFDVDLARDARARASHVHLSLDSYAGRAAIDGDPSTYWAAPAGTTRCFLDVELPREQIVDRVVLGEPAALGQRIEDYQLQGRRDNQWLDLHRGEAIGLHRVLPVDPGRYQAFRLIVREARAAPALATFGLYTAPPKVQVHVDETVFMGATRVRFSTSNPAAEVRYTLDGSLPTEGALLYSRALYVEGICVVTALASTPGNPGLVPARVALRGYTYDTLPEPVEPASESGLRVRAWRGAFGSLDGVDHEAAPDLDGVTESLTGPVLEGPHAALLTGLVHAPRAGIYGFFARGAVRVQVGGELAVESAGAEPVLGELGLAAGWHTLRVEVLRSVQEEIDIQWRGPALAKRPIEAKELGR